MISARFPGQRPSARIHRRAHALRTESCRRTGTRMIDRPRSIPASCDHFGPASGRRITSPRCEIPDKSHRPHNRPGQVCKECEDENAEGPEMISGPSASWWAKGDLNPFSRHPCHDYVFEWFEYDLLNGLCQDTTLPNQPDGSAAAKPTSTAPSGRPSPRGGADGLIAELHQTQLGPSPRVQGRLPYRPWR